MKVSKRVLLFLAGKMCIRDRVIVYGGGAPSLLCNILWLIFGGFALAISAVIHGLIFCITIVGIPFGMQCFKFARLALTPFGSDVAFCA